MRIDSKSTKSVPKSSCLLGSRPRTRRLFCESLESRSLMAADSFEHNFVMPEDTNSGGFVSPIDALIVINELNARDENKQVPDAVDVNADGFLSPVDALLVINFLNRTRTSEIQDKVSGVDSESRILRIEQAIANQTLPGSMELGTAQHLLAVLRSGGHPEIGDRMLNGRLTSDHGMSEQQKANEAEIAKYVSEGRIGVGAPFMDAQQLMTFANAMKLRLEAIGANSEICIEVAQEIQTQEGSSLQNVIEMLKARLEDLDVDVAEALPERLDVQLSVFIEQLRSAGVDEEEIIAISNDLRLGYESGESTTIELPGGALIRFEVNSPIDFPSEADRMISFLTELLVETGVNREIVSTIIGEVKAAYLAGQPLTTEQINARLIELGTSPLPIGEVSFNDSFEMLESLKRYFAHPGM